MRALEDRVNGLESEVVRLRGQLSNITSSGEKPQDKNTGSSGKAETLPSNPNTLPTPVSTAAVPTTTAAIAQTTASGATSGEKTTKTPNPGGP